MQSLQSVHAVRGLQLTTFFVGQDAENDQAELAGVKSIKALQAEITALRTEIQAGFTTRFRPMTCYSTSIGQSFMNSSRGKTTRHSVS